MNEVKVGFIIDPLSTLTPIKDTSIALMLEVTNIGGEIFVANIEDLIIENKRIYAYMDEIKIQDGEQWYSVINTVKVDLNSLDHIWLRKDPPFDQKYLYATYLLDLVVRKGGRVFNNPTALRDFNEKIATLNFNCVPESIVSTSKQSILQFLEQHDSIVMKSLDSFGGRGVILLTKDDVNKETLIGIMTDNGSIPIMAQKYIPEIVDGDKRILIINGEPYSKSLARIPKPGDLRGNMDAGATGKVMELSSNDLSICEEIIPSLKRAGIVFAGIDVIGQYCTEINITSPTCVRELEALTGENIASKILLSVLK